MQKVYTIRVTKSNKGCEHRTIFDNDDGEGCISCACGKIYDFSLKQDINLVNFDGFVYPRCPSCHETPYSETRRTDL